MPFASANNLDFQLICFCSIARYYLDIGCFNFNYFSVENSNSCPLPFLWWSVFNICCHSVHIPYPSLLKTEGAQMAGNYLRFEHYFFWLKFLINLFTLNCFQNWILWIFSATTFYYLYYLPRIYKFCGQKLLMKLKMEQI